MSELTFISQSQTTWSASDGCMAGLVICTLAAVLQYNSHKNGENKTVDAGNLKLEHENSVRNIQQIRSHS